MHWLSTSGAWTAEHTMWLLIIVAASLIVALVRRQRNKDE